MSLWTLTDAAVRTTAFLGIAAVLAILLRQHSAALRHLVWAFGLGGALVMPLAGLLMPAAPIPVPRVLADALPMLATGSGAVSPAGEAIGAGPTGVADRGRGERPSIADAVTATRHARAAEPASAGPVPDPAAIAASGPGKATAAPPTAARAPAVPGSGLLALWGLGAAVFGAWVLAGAWSTRRLASAATAVTSAEWLDALREVRQDLGIQRPVRLLRSDHAVTPMTWGWRRPVVLVPAAALGWSSERRSVVLRHELAHVTRGDAVTRLLARWTCAVYWFNPMVWFAAYRLRVEGERACDDAVLRLGTLASEYAGHLLGIARDHNALRLRAPAAVAMARPSQLEGRLRAILDPRIRRAARRSTAVLGAAVLAVAALAVSVVAPAAQTGAPVPVLAPAPAGGQDPASETDTEPTEPQVEPVLELRVGEDRIELRRPDGTAEEPGDTVIELRGNVLIAGRRTARLRILRPPAVVALDPESEALNRIAVGGLADYGTRNPIEAVRQARRQARREIDPRLADTFIGALGDPDAEVRERAARALGRHRVPEGVEALRAALRDDDPAVREGAAWALGRIGGGGAVGALLGALGDPEPEVRAGAASALGMIRSPAAVDGLVAALDDPDVRVRDRTARALGRTRDRIATGAVDAVASATLEVIEGFRRTGGDLALEALIRLMDVSDPELRRAAIAALSGGRWFSPGDTAETPQPPAPGVTGPAR